MPNKLINETSPYLLQHAHNPVNWYPWGNEALTKAKDANKLILVSIGYSACHWCHVMERESFENEQVARIMNEHFICIKVDREERPDIDQIYMNAVQLMTGSGGWPLNCFCLPDQRPVYGGTYFRTEDWQNLLLSLAAFWRERPDEAREYAERLTEGINKSEVISFIQQQEKYSINDLTAIYEPWKRHFDPIEGGYNRAPKFPLPNNWQFMLRYAHLLKDESAATVTRITLNKMAYGGIYDHIGGGFARYSVDDRWHVPHFEKMLYDNAQLVSLYTEGWQLYKEDEYKQIVYQTLDWVKREMLSPEGGFYSALDADSEGVEGKFYTFTKAEIAAILKDDSELFCIYYHITEKGNWPEEHTNVLYRSFTDEELSEKLGISLPELQEKIGQSKKQVFAYRDRRVHPGLDNKILASWNGMMLKAFTDAYRVFGEPDFLDMALTNARFITQKLTYDNYTLQRTFKLLQSGSPIAFLDDYAFVIDALIGLYEATFDECWLEQAQKYTIRAKELFFDAGSGMFFYTASTDEALVARKYEILDNVIPSSNSVMAINLYKLGHFYDDESYLSMARQMLANVKPQIKSYGSSYSNWATLLLYEVFGVYEIAITGEQWSQFHKEIEKNFIPNKILLGGNAGTLPLLSDKSGSESKIYICKNRTCKLPVTNTEDAIKQILNEG
ncbi:thioredoxin domain-containing protein [Pedobacter sp. BS3]|uniref:thioredoxin domain-containing protein n=1 Tax=Pedobacter sp. BS3 TaxID=2567937 RepID=UPI0011EBEE5C|nr:thioredoxin domain-containing protein [Pedobacter sp. BS3]TZF82745.1 thioredoxin domain-containing protein [Pedobacter sp. BS3]